jgi:uridine phosphorylase
MKTAKELVDLINAAGRYAPHEVKAMEEMNGVTEITTTNSEEHRWYVLGTVVYKVGDEFFGVRGPVTLKSFSMGWDDVGTKCVAFEMEQVPTVTYERKRTDDKAQPRGEAK